MAISDYINRMKKGYRAKEEARFEREKADLRKLDESPHTIRGKDLERMKTKSLQQERDRLRKSESVRLKQKKLNKEIKELRGAKKKETWEGFKSKSKKASETVGKVRGFIRRSEERSKKSPIRMGISSNNPFTKPSEKKEKKRSRVKKVVYYE